jgi:hypothetical protein
MTKTNSSKTERDFTRSFLWWVPLHKGCKHSWKNHAYRGTLAYDVLRWLDLWAANNEQRLVFCKIDGLLTACNSRRMDGKQYKKRYLKQVLSELRARHIISRYFTVRNGKYTGRRAFLMEPHDCRSRVIDGQCVMRAPKRFEGPDALISAPPGYRLCTDLLTACAPLSAPTTENQRTAQRTAQRTDDSAQPDDFSNFTEDDATKWLAERGLIGAPKPLKSVSHGSLETFKPLKPLKSCDQGQGQPQKQDRKHDDPSSLVLTNLKPKATPATKKGKSEAETITEHFLACESLLELMTDYELDESCIPAWWKDEDRDHLEECMMEAVSAKGDRPYCGRKTDASLMGDTMKLLMEIHETKAPPPWLPVMQLLRDNPPPQPLPVDKNRVVMDCNPLKPSAWHVENGYEYCSDKIWRPKLDRDNQGFTVKGEDGIWRKD